MLIRFFRPNQPAILIAFLPLLALLLWIPGFLKYPYPESFEYTMPLYDAMVYLVSGVPYLSGIIGLLLVYTQALLLNHIVNKNDIFKPRTNLPALMYVIVMSSMIELQMMHPIVFANLFLLFAIDRISSVYVQKTVFSQVFDAGSLIALASFFYFPAIVFFLFVCGSLLIARTFIWREYVIAFLGLIVPYAFLLTYYFWIGEWDTMFREKMFPYFSSVHIILPELVAADYALVVFLLILLGLSLFTMLKIMANNVMRVLYLLRFFFILLLIGFVAVLFDNNRNVQTIALGAVPFAVFTANYFLYFKRKWLAEIILLALLGLIIFNFYAEF